VQASEVPIARRAPASTPERAQEGRERAREWMQAWAQAMWGSQAMWESQAMRESQAMWGQAAEVRALALRGAPVEVRALAHVQVQAWQKVHERETVQERWVATARWEGADAWAEAVGRALELARALAVTLAYEIPLLASTMDELPHPVGYPPYLCLCKPTYAEVLADLEIKAIIDSIERDYLHRLARHLWHHSEHWWLIQVIAPITRLPPELLQSILSTIIDASNPPLVLMFVCKHWYTSVTSIWASLKLGTRTPRDVVTRMLERSQLPLDIFFDTEIDRGRFTQSRGAYQGILAVIEATHDGEAW